LVQATDS